ncbi:MAG: FeoA family protein [Bacteroidota bacterium]
MCTLDNFKINTHGQIKSVKTSPLASKLIEMGLYPGKQVRVLFKAPFGDPLAVEVGDYTISLRKKEASLIEIDS